ncbi:RND efflux system, outer membrane lipoprotein, NodT family [Candidatus Sulfotelmatobacter sp. SbA7]|nr:RND efflux system, outer membrane lipoprotein, NodT family [Candidatus Sulfotelmatobacter sp. SbA7]
MPVGHRVCRTAILLGIALLTGCAVGPRYARPAAPTPPDYKETPPNWKEAQPSDQVLRGKWWEIYRDWQLNAFEEKIAVSNRSLKAAEAQFAQARATVRYYRADLFPTLSAGVSATRERFSSNRPLAQLSGGGTFNDLVIPVDMTYEPDVWGRVRRNVEAYRASAQASFADLEAVSLSLHAELAMDYFQARELDAEAQLLDSTVEGYQRSLELNQNRYQGGVVSQVDVAQAQTLLETARAQAIDVKAQRTQFEHAIAVLVGEPAPSFTLPVAALNATPPVIPPGLPSQLLERRPDIASSERQMAMANANIGVAKAAYFPLFNFSPSAGFESTTVANWLSNPSTFVTVGVSAMATILDVGRRRAALDQARAAYDQTVASYQQNVLVAYQEVEDNLAALRLLEQEANTDAAAVAAAEHSLDLSKNRYTGGVTTYLEVITAQTTALADERSAVQVSGRRMIDSVLLIKALGGGWDAASLAKLDLTSRKPYAPPPAPAAPTGQ